ncbi:hypothetical protein ABEG18_17905 [Alsobacter sp. KACC 23698]|uniref:Uncharacterized protein n=1 Tax=Alsobacter sp. KACC 23698 TaxID=3149229 RepID=A0AAU7JBH8_9HYPH
MTQTPSPRRPAPDDIPPDQRSDAIEPTLPVEDEDVDPLEPGGIAPGSPPGETFGSTGAVPIPEAELRERAKRRNDLG